MNENTPKIIADNQVDNHTLTIGNEKTKLTFNKINGQLTSMVMNQVEVAVTESRFYIWQPEMDWERPILVTNLNFSTTNPITDYSVDAMKQRWFTLHRQQTSQLYDRLSFLCQWTCWRHLQFKPIRQLPTRSKLFLQQQYWRHRLCGTRPRSDLWIDKTAL